jgi:RNAse (barnase) inhibitor barstar
MATTHHLQAFLQSAVPPWASLLVIPPEKTVTTLIKPSAGYALRILQGKKCATPSGLFNEFARALEFPEYFGHNWDALEECLADLEWLPAKGYALLMADAQAVIPDDEEDYETLLEVLNDAGEAWSKGQTAEGRRAPFHAFFAITEEQKLTRKHWGLEELLLAEPNEEKQAKRSTDAKKKSPRPKRT